MEFHQHNNTDGTPNLLGDSISNSVIFKQMYLGDDEITYLPSNTAGWGSVMIGDNQEFTQFRWTSASATTMFNNTANVDISDTDGDLCVYDAGDKVAIKNRLGSTLLLRYQIFYS